MTNETKVEDTSADNTSKEVESKPNNKTDNKALFGPLGKYAIVAVIMVSIIVTTAIMLDKQLNTVEQELAVLEKEVSDSSDTQNDEIVTTAAPFANETPAADTVTNEATVTEAASEQTIKDKTSVETTAEIKQTEHTPSTKVASETVTEDTTPAKIDRAQRDIESKARVAENKQDRKQHISEKYARINKRELQQLEQYKVSQDKRIARLREQNTQQQVIDALIQRNNEIFSIREANMQKQQASREQMLNRI